MSTIFNPFPMTPQVMPQAQNGLGAFGSYSYRGQTTPMWINEIKISGVTANGLVCRDIHLLPPATQLVGLCSHGIQFRVNG